MIYLFINIIIYPCLKCKRQYIIIMTELTLDMCDKKTPLFDIRGVYDAKVVHCYDGDTIHCVMLFNGVYNRFKVRMSGYDTAEMKPKKALGLEVCEKIKEEAHAAKDRLCALILNKCVKLDCDGFDKYGRLLGTVFCDEINVNDLMVEEGFGYVYNGGTKQIKSYSST